MSLLHRCALLLLCGLLAVPAAAQEGPDGIDALDGSMLAPVTLKYETNLKMGQRSMARPTVRTIVEGTHDGESVWRVVDAVENAAQADTLFLHRASLRPLQRRVGGRMALTLTFDSLSVAGSLRARGQARPVRRTFDQTVLSSTPNMEVALATLPLEPGYTVELPIFHLQQRNVTPTMLRVTGMDTVTVPAGTFETYVIEAQPDGPGPTGTYYVRTAAPHHVVRANLEITRPQGRTVTATKQLTSVTEDAGGGTK
jgi:hypothetical protein